MEWNMKVTGMSCAGCVRSLTNALKAIDPVAQVEVHLSEQRVRVESRQSLEALKLAIEEAGFAVQEARASS